MKYLERPWTKEEEQFLLDHSDRWSAREIGKALNRSKSSIIGKRNRMGLAQSKWEPKPVVERHVYLQEYLSGNGYHQVKHLQELEQWRKEDVVRERRASFRLL